MIFFLLWDYQIFALAIELLLWSDQMDLKLHYPQNTIIYCIISNEAQITLHFFRDEFLLYQM